MASSDAHVSGFLERRVGRSETTNPTIARCSDSSGRHLAGLALDHGRPVNRQRSDDQWRRRGYRRPYATGASYPITADSDRGIARRDEIDCDTQAARPVKNPPTERGSRCRRFREWQATDPRENEE